MKILIIGNVKHDGAILDIDEVYDIDEKAAHDLIDAKFAKAVSQDYPKKKVSTYTPMQVKRDDKGNTLPGQQVAATEATSPSAKVVKAVEPKQEDVKGADTNGKKQEQSEKRKEETKEK